MKKFSLMAFAASLMFVTASCEDDDTPNYETPNYLLGKWELRQTGQMSASNIVSYGPVQQPGICALDNLVFDADNSYSQTAHEVAGEACNAETTEGTYALVGRDLTLQMGNESVSATVISLTFQNMEISTSDADGNLLFLKLRKAE